MSVTLLADEKATQLHRRDSQQERRMLLLMSFWVTFGTVALTLIGCWLANVSLWPQLQWNGIAIGSGLVLSVPLLAVFFVLKSLPFEPLRRVFRIVAEYFGPAMASCRVIELALVAIGAGISEEMLFRGLLPTVLAGRGVLVAIILPNVLFGLLHAATITYAVIATCIGLFFSVCLTMCPEINLLTVMVAHAAYDFIAFLVVAGEHRQLIASDGN